MCFFFRISPRTAQCDIVYHFQTEWRIPLFIKHIREGIQEISIKLLEEVSPKLWVRPTIVVDLLANLCWHDIGLQLPLRIQQAPEQNDKNLIITKILQDDITFIKKNIYILEGRLAEYQDKIKLEKAISRYINNKNYDYIGFIEGNFYVKDRETNQVFSLNKDDNFKLILNLWKAGYKN